MYNTAAWVKKLVTLQIHTPGDSPFCADSRGFGVRIAATGVRTGPAMTVPERFGTVNGENDRGGGKTN